MQRPKPGAGSRVPLFGIPIDNLTEQELFAQIAALVERRQPAQVCYVNADCVNKAFGNKAYRMLLETSDLVYADGMGVVFASWFIGQPLKARLTGADIFPGLCRLCAERGYRIFIVGGEPGIVDRAVANIQRDHPDLRIVGTHHGFLSPGESAALVQRIRQAQPDILLVGMGAPRQEMWIRDHMEELGVPVQWGVGALFDYYAERFPRAPVWMRNIGLEWLFRLILEPQRLWKRYVIGNVVFAMRVGFLFLLDLFIAAMSWIGAWELRYWLNPVFLRFGGKPINEIDPYYKILPFLLLGWIIVCNWRELYERRRHLMPFLELVSLVRSTLLYGLIAAGTAFMFKELQIGRSVVLLSVLANFLLMSGARLLFHVYETKLLRRGYGRARVIVVGAGPLGEKVRQRMLTDPWREYEILGVVDDTPPAELNGTVPYLGVPEDLPELVSTHAVTEVVIAVPEVSKQRVLNLVVDCGDRNPDLEFRLVSDIFEVMQGEIDIESINDTPVTTMGSGRVDLPFRWAKRTLDLAGGLCLLVPFLCCYVIFGPLIRWSTGGSVLFKHRRVGKDGKEFLIYKFRTMHAGVDPDQNAPASPDDTRIAGWVGRFLRRFSIDELPQVLNVLKGDMSLVGPRPEMPHIVANYEKWQRRRLAVKPGITGLWQVIGRKDLPLHANLELDFYYIQNQSILLDLTILLRTIPAVLVGKGAY